MYQGELYSGDKQYRQYRKTRSQYELELNSEQYRAVTHGDGPLLVLAGAGTGKTRTLVYRLAWLIEQGVDPASVLLLTFTRKAAEEMRGRAVALVGDAAEKVPGGTFHSTAAAVLRRCPLPLPFGYSRSFTVLSQSDAVRILKAVRCIVMPPAGRAPRTSVAMRLLSSADSFGLPIWDYIERHAPEYWSLGGWLYSLYGEYVRYKQEHNLMDYNDLLTVFYEVLQADIDGQVRSRYRYVLVDEYQDTDSVQARVVHNLVRDHGNVFAVGDDAQSVYGWRGADVTNITRFRDRYPQAETVRLQENYRSVKGVLRWANEVIPKGLYSFVAGDSVPSLCVCQNKQAEDELVVDWIVNLVDAGVPLSEIAVLYRYNARSRSLEMLLNGRGIPYEKRGGCKTSESLHVQDVLAYPRILINPRDALAWTRVLTAFPRLGEVTADKIFASVKDRERPLEAFYELKGAGAWAEPFEGLKGLLRRLEGRSDPTAVLSAVYEFYRPFFIGLYSRDFLGRQDDLDDLLSHTRRFFRIETFLDAFYLEPSEKDKCGVEGDQGGIVLSTVHSAKGLEFDSVAVVGCSEMRWNRPNSSRDQYEEDRRLLYVAMTRAKENLMLSYAKKILTRSGKSFHDSPVGYFDRPESGGKKYYRVVQIEGRKKG